MRITQFGSAVINSDGTLSVAFTVGPDTTIEGTFLGYVAATVQNIGGSGADPLAAIIAEAEALNIVIPMLSVKKGK